MKTKDVKRANRPSLSDETLAMEIKNAQTQFEMSCHWLVSLAEQLEHFPNNVIDAVELLEKIQRQARQGKIAKGARKKLYRALKTLRLYSRMLASEDEPLNCIDACESAFVFEDHLAASARCFINQAELGAGEDSSSEAA